MTEASHPTPPAPGDAAAPAAAWRFENCEFDALQLALRVDGLTVDVEPRPLRLLAELLQHCNEVLTREELLESVWEGRPTVDHVLANAVSKLRTALGEAGAARLQTVPRVGYRLVGPVQRIALHAPVLRQQAGMAVPGREGFVLERPLGRTLDGGVWLARHAKLGHPRVFKFAEDGARLAALKREYTLFRLLRRELGPRADVVELVDANFAQAPFWLEIEYAGPNLLEWAQEAGRLQASSSQERLALFLQIAHAVAAAHSVGVLHKDIKPGNVLVTARSPGDSTTEPASALPWQLKLTDFGSGRLLQPERLQALQLTALELTGQGSATEDSASGTRLYQPPEVLAGQPPSLQADVYALGVLLFQLVTAQMQRPLATGWQREVADDLLVADITAATEGDPASRLRTVDELVRRIEGLERRRAEQLQSARQAQRQAELQLALRQSRARRPWVIAALGALGVGLCLSVYFQRQASQALAQAHEAGARAQAINEFLNRDVLQAADITTVGPRKSLLLPDVLASASRKAAVRFRDLPVVEAELRLQLGELLFRMGSFKSAEAEFDAARRRLQAADDAPIALQLQTQYALARALTAQSRLEPAQAMVQDADAMAARLPAGADAAVAFAAAKTKAVLLGMLQRYDEAVAQSRLAVDLADQRDPGDLGTRFVTRRQLAEMLMRIRAFDEAERLLGSIMAEPYTPDAVGEVVFARAQVQWARLRHAQNRTAESEPALLSAIGAIEARLGPNELMVGALHEELGRTYSSQGKFELSRLAHLRAQQVFTVIGGADHQGARVNSLNAALVDLNAGSPAAALARLDADRPWFVRHMGGEGSSVVLLIDFFRARASLDLGRTAVAAAVLPKLTPEQLSGASSAPWADVLDAERGRLAWHSGDKAGGRQRLAAALERLQAGKADPWDLPRYAKLLARSPPAQR
jgi:serine/threonine protein kinase/DNA-binding winged helix-turn-helix (wHTH) protein